MADSGYIYSYRSKGTPDKKKPGGGGKKIVLAIVMAIVIISGYLIYKAVTADKPGPSDKPDQVDNGGKPDDGSGEKPDIPNTNVPLSPDYKGAMTALGQEDYIKARDIIRKVLAGVDEKSSNWQKYIDVLNEVNTEIFMSDIPCKEKKLYTVVKNDNFINIAKKFNTTLEALQKSNGLSPDNPVIFPDQTLYIFEGDWKVEVHKKKFRLYLYNGKDLFKVYKIGIGKQDRTPVGSFRVNLKQKEPTWYPKGKPPVPFGTKENVLGTRWMSLEATGETNTNFRGYGIHGTWEPESIGTAASNGCIRMKNEDVDELFTILPYRTTVIIKD